MRDGDSVLTYPELLERVNAAQSYYPALQTGSLVEFVSNLVVALARGGDVVLSIPT